MKFVNKKNILMLDGVEVLLNFLMDILRKKV